MIKFIHHQVSFSDNLHVHQYTHTASADPVNMKIYQEIISMVLNAEMVMLMEKAQLKVVYN